MLAVTRAGEDLQARELLARQHRSARRGLDVVDRQHQDARARGARGAQQIQPRGIPVVDLVAEAPHEIHVRLAAVEGSQ